MLPRLQDRLLRTLTATGAFDEAAQTLADARFLAAACGGQSASARRMRAEHADAVTAARSGRPLASGPATSRPDARGLEFALGKLTAGREAEGDRLVERAALLFAAGRLDEARSDLRTALARDPEDLRVRALLAVVLARAAETTSARAVLRDPAGKPRLEVANVDYLVAAMPTALDAAFRAEVTGLLE